MKQMSRYTKLGILITVSIVIFIWGMNFLKGINFFSDNAVFYAVYPRIDGLQESSPVMLNGFKVGQVKKIRFTGSPDGSLLVSFSLSGDFRITKGSEARIVSSDLMGTRSIKLIMNDSIEFYQPSDTIAGSIEGDLREQVSMQVMPLKNKAEQMLSSLDSAIEVITYIFNPEARENLASSFAHINMTITNLEETSGMLRDLLNSRYGNLQNIVSNIDNLTGTLSASSADLSNIASNLSNITDSIEMSNIGQTMAHLSLVVEGAGSILQSINEGKGTAGRLINDEELYGSILSLSYSLDDLLTDLRKNPKRYVHFSAIDLSKEIYLTSKAATVKDDSKYTFRVNLATSPARINTSTPLFSGFQPVEEMNFGGLFNYFTGYTTDIEEITAIHDKAIAVFPDARITAFKNGRPVKLEKAIKKIGK